MQDFSSHSISDVLQTVGTTTDGLSQEEAHRRFFQYGPNKLPEVIASLWPNGWSASLPTSLPFYSGLQLASPFSRRPSNQGKGWRPSAA